MTLQKDFQNRSLDQQQHLEDSINHMNKEWWLHFAGWATEQGIDSRCPTAAHVATFLLSLCRDYGLVPQALKDGVSAEPHQQVGDGAGQNYH